MMLSLVSCDKRDALSNDKKEIQDLLYNFQSAFNYKDIETLMAGFHVDYLHDGYIVWTIRERWLDLFSTYDVLTIETIDISIEYFQAVVTMRLRFESPTLVQSYNAPEEMGDVSYLYYEDNRWQFHGNREYIKHSEKD